MIGKRYFTSSLYFCQLKLYTNIAQVKAKYGIKERANYNLPKLEDVKQPHCPKEKEDAIVEALRFFHMI